jgi:hypothetical protein
MKAKGTRWLTYTEVVQMIEACMGSNGKYTLGLWTQGEEPVLKRRYFPKKKRALYCAKKVRELVGPVDGE